MPEDNNTSPESAEPNRSPRTSNLEMPDVHEVLKMLKSAESHRVASTVDVIDRELAAGTFDGFRDLEGQIGVDDIFSIDRQVASEGSLQAAIDNVYTSTRAIIEALQTKKFDERLTNRIYDALSVQDELEPADAIFVFGAPSNARVEKAIELYKAGISTKLIVSGHGPHWAAGVHITEAERMAQAAVHAGIPQGDILVEPESVSIPDNVKRTVDAFDQTGFYPESLIIVSSQHALLRSFIDWQKFPPRPIRLMRTAPPVVNQDLSRERWAVSGLGRVSVVNEYAKIVTEALVDGFLASEEGRTLLNQSE